MDECAYEEGGLSSLIATKSLKRKTAVQGTLANKKRLSGIFNDPTADDYAIKPVESVSI